MSEQTVNFPGVIKALEGTEIAEDEEPSGALEADGVSLPVLPLLLEPPQPASDPARVVAAAAATRI
ncbi:hypothetical protein [Leekyejoonella antrihumi]|uniref:hypothetical protein n=1 Tax=Leekyejoonella antrihumi TaxID=1660198 RepID=UPI001C983C96|nr:hypothetical protein [Leekyejoonella antrihumi]